MKYKQGRDVVLGVNVTNELIEAVLLQAAGDEVNVIRRFIRQRASSQEFATTKSLAKALPGLQGSEDADYTLDVGDGHGASPSSEVTFLASEFGGLSGKKDRSASNKAVESPGNGQVLFASQLGEILDECRSEGYSTPGIAFCVGAPDVSYTELVSDIQPKQKADSRASTKAEGRMSRRALLELLRENRVNPFDQERVAFVPLAPSGGRQRYVAIVPETSEAVKGTLETLMRRDRSLPRIRLMDAELSAYARLIRRTIPEDQPERITALIRVGSEDTLILFFSGPELRHWERLRSLSSYDSPETVCSRVLLQQDEQKIGELDHVVVLSEGRSEKVLDKFRQAYPNAAVESVNDALTGLGVHPPRDSDGLAAGSVPAVAAGLRLLGEWDRLDPMFAVHLLPKQLQRDRRKLALAWHTVAVLVVLVATSFFFSWRFMDRQHEINREREEMRLNPIEMPVDNPALLQARVDSLRHAYVTYTHALKVIDSLLVGSDRWTRLHEGITRSTRAIGGIWLNKMEPMGTNSIRINGTATTRTRVAQLARRHTGSVEKASSFDIKHESRDIQLYDFVVTVPMKVETPRVALYLQDVAAGLIQDHAVDSVLAAYEMAGGLAAGDDDAQPVMPN